MNQILIKFENLFKLPTGEPTHCQVRHTIGLILGNPLPNEPVYHRSVLGNHETKSQIQELIEKGHIHPSAPPCGSSMVLAKKKDEILEHTNKKYNERHDEYHTPHNFKVGDKVWLHIQKELLKPYFPPLLDVVETISTTGLNPHAASPFQCDQIVDTMVKTLKQ